MTDVINIKPCCLDLGLSDNIKVARKEAAFLKEVTNMVASRPRSLGLGETNKILNDLVKERGNSGKKMMKIGTALIIMPDPITGAIGVPLLVAGKMIDNRQSLNLKNVYEEVDRTLSSLSSVVSSL